MKLNKPLITICLIIILAVNLIFFSFLSIGKKSGDKEYVTKIANSFNFKKYLLNNEIISTSINSYKYPKEVFDYLDNTKIKELKDKIINNLFDEKNIIIDKSDFIFILSDSVYKYEYNKMNDIFLYVEDDINEFSASLENKINKELSKDYYNIKDFSCGFIYTLSILASIVIFTLIIMFEKKQGILISSIVLFVYSFFVFYINKYFISFGFKNLLKYFKNINLELDNLYIITFILSVILFIIYMIFVIKKVMRNIRISSYNRR